MFVLSLAFLLAGLALRLVQAIIPPEAMPLLQLILQAAPAVLAIVGITGGLKGLFDRVDALPGLHGIGAVVATFAMGAVVLTVMISVGWWTFPTDGAQWQQTWLLLTALAMWFRDNTGVANLGKPKTA